MEAHRRIRNLTLGQLMQRCDPKLTNVPKEVLEEGMLRHYFGEKAVPAKQRMLMREVELVCERHVYNFVINLQKAKDYVSFMNETDSDSIMRALVRLKEFEGPMQKGRPLKGYISSTMEHFETRLKELGKEVSGFQRIHGPSLEVFIPNLSGATMEEALEKAEKENRVIASNKRLDRALVGSDEWESIRKALWCWTGTMTAYEKPGKKFGKTVEYVDDETKLRYVFEVPDQYFGEKDAVLVSEHPNYKLETDGNNRVIRAAVVDLIERFPAEDGRYLADPKHGIPIENQVDDSDADARYLWRIEKRVGLSARIYFDFGYDCRFVCLDYLPSSALGVAVEAPERGAKK